MELSKAPLGGCLPGRDPAFFDEESAGPWLCAGVHCGAGRVRGLRAKLTVKILMNRLLGWEWLCANDLSTHPPSLSRSMVCHLERGEYTWFRENSEPGRVN